MCQVFQAQQLAYQYSANPDCRAAVKDVILRVELTGDSGGQEQTRATSFQYKLNPKPETRNSKP